MSGHEQLFASEEDAGCEAGCIKWWCSDTFTRAVCFNTSCDVYAVLLWRLGSGSGGDGDNGFNGGSSCDGGDFNYILVQFSRAVDPSVTLSLGGKKKVMNKTFIMSGHYVGHILPIFFIVSNQTMSYRSYPSHTPPLPPPGLVMSADEARENCLRITRI